VSKRSVPTICAARKIAAMMHVLCCYSHRVLEGWARCALPTLRHPCAGTPLLLHALMPHQLTMEEFIMGRYLLLWLLGVPIPILVLIYAFGGLH